MNEVEMGASLLGGLDAVAAGPRIANLGNKVKSRTADFIDDAGVGRLGGELYDTKKLSQLDNYLNKRGVELRVGDEHVPLGSTKR